MTNFEWVKSMPAPVLAQWLCDINKCESCFFAKLKDENYPGTCTWQWLNKEFPLPEGLYNEGSEQNQQST